MKSVWSRRKSDTFWVKSEDALEMTADVADDPISATAAFR
jgi:hypothetical protein